MNSYKIKQSPLDSNMNISRKLSMAIKIENIEDPHIVMQSLKCVSSQASLRSSTLGNQTKRFIVVKKTFVDKDGIIIGDNKKVTKKARKTPDLALRHIESDNRLKEI